MAEEDSCTYVDLIANMANACTYANHNCQEKFEVFNLYALRYCNLPDGTFGTFLFWVLAILLTIAAFYLLGNLASTYLTPVLTKVSEALNLSETVSGVTLLAFANGAPDIIASFAAGKAEGGLYITIGNLYGAGLFCSTLVIARCIQVSSRRIQMERGAWSRDLTFYLFTSLILILYGIIGYITIWMSLVFVVVYLVYITVVIYQDRQTVDDRASEAGLRHEHDKETLENKLNKLIHNEMHDKLLSESIIDEDSGKSTSRKLTLTQAEVKHIYQNELDNAKEEANELGEQSTLDKVVDYITLPLRIIPMITIPNLEKEDLAKPFSPVLALTSSLACTFFMSGFEFDFTVFGVNGYIWASIVGILAFGAAFLLKSRGNSLFEWILLPFALVASILWLKTAAGSIVDLITYISEVYGVNKVLLGATFLGIGNTLADFFANASLAALGYGVMACTGSIAGQLFNLLMGLPINVFQSVRDKTVKQAEFKLIDFSSDKQTKAFAMMIIWMLIFQLIFLFFMSISTKFELNKKLAKANVVVYLACYVTFFVSYAFISN